MRARVRPDVGKRVEAAHRLHDPRCAARIAGAARVPRGAHPADADAVADGEPRVGRRVERVALVGRLDRPRGRVGILAPGHCFSRAQARDPGVHLALAHRPAPKQALLGAPQPPLVVARAEVLGRIHLLADRTARACAEPLDADERRQREHAQLPLLVETTSEPGVTTPRSRASRPCRGRRPSGRVYASSASADRIFARRAWSSVARTRSAPCRSRRSLRSCRRRASSRPVRSSIASRSARAPSSARSATSSSSSVPPVTRARGSGDAAVVEVVGRQRGELGDAATGCGRPPRAGSRSRWSPASRSRGVVAVRTGGRARGTVRPARGRRASRAAGRAGRRGAAAPPGAPASPPPRARISRARTNASCRSAVALELDPDPVVEVALRRAEPPRERVGRVGGSSPFGSATTRTSNPCFTASSIPRRVASCPAASASKQRKRRFVSRPSSRELVLGQRRAHRRDDRLDPGLSQRDHVGVPLDDDRAVLLRDRRAARDAGRRGRCPS